MVSIEYCFIVTFLVQCIIHLTFSKKTETELLFNHENLQNLIRSRRHTEPFDLYQQPFNPVLHKRKRGFLTNLKEKIMSFITGRNKRYQRPNIPEEVIEDESINNLELNPENDNKIEEATSSTQMEIENNLGNADLVSRLRKMLANYEKTLKNLKKAKPSHKKYKKHNTTMNSHENFENIDRKKRYSEKKEAKNRRIHSINSVNKITTSIPSTYLSIGSHADDHNPKNYNFLEETKKRDKILKSVLRLGSRKKHHKSTKHSKYYRNEKINNEIKDFNSKGAKFFIYDNSNEKTNQNKKSKHIYSKSSGYLSSNEKVLNHMNEFVCKESKTIVNKFKEKPNSKIEESKHKELKASGNINSNEKMNDDIKEFEYKDSKISKYLSSNENANIHTKEYKHRNIKSSGYINSNEKTIIQTKVSKHKGDSFSHEYLENSI